MARLSLLRFWPALFCLLALAPRARAQDTTMPGLYAPEGDWLDQHDRSKDEPPPQFRFISYFFTRASFTDVVGDPSGLKGVSLGPLGEQAGSLVESGLTGPTGYFEQRWIPVITFAPHFVDGLAEFHAQFRINYIWGLAANTVQGNQGGGFNAEQINIQTKNLNVSLYPTRDPDDLTIIVGTQPAYDSPLDPTRYGLNDLTRTGYKLSFLGSDATGISLYSQRHGNTKLSWLPLGSAQPNNATTGDPRLQFVWLATLDHQHEIAPGTWIGGSIWYLRDDTQGDADAYQGLVRSGPASGGLSAYTGTAPFLMDQPSGWVGWLGINAHHNIDFRTGRFAADGFLMYNGGKYVTNDPTTVLNQTTTISGLSGDLELLYNWGHSINDVLSFEFVGSSGDKNPLDNHYNSAFTLNYYGLPGATFFTHRTLLLFPFTSTVVNYSGAVTDLSNQGEGLRAGIVAATYDLIPNKLNFKVGAAYGRSQNTPQPFVGSVTPRGKYIGTEINAELKYTIRYLMTLGLHAGYLFRGDWFDGETSRVTADPYAVFLTFTWYAF